MSESAPVESNFNQHIQLSEQYYKSRKQLMLFSGLFFVYEFIGIKVPAKPFPNIEIEFLSPEAVPIVLLILVLYYSYRTLLGWYQSNKQIREYKVARWDLYPTIIIPIISILLYSYQEISKSQLASIILLPSIFKGFVILIVFLASILAWESIEYYEQVIKPMREENLKFSDIIILAESKFLILFPPIMLIVSIGLSIIITITYSWVFFFTFFGFYLGIISIYFVRRLLKKRLRNN